MQKLYTFFSASPQRWQKLVKNLEKKKVLKSLSDTRWSARIDAVSAVHDGYSDVLASLEEIINDSTQTNDTRLEARSLQEKLAQFNNIFLLMVWNDILSKIHASNLTLQKEKIHLGIVVDLLDSSGLFKQFERSILCVFG